MGFKATTGPFQTFQYKCQPVWSRMISWRARINTHRLFAFISTSMSLVNILLFSLSICSRSKLFKIECSYTTSSMRFQLLCELLLQYVQQSPPSCIKLADPQSRLIILKINLQYDMHITSNIFSNIVRCKILPHWLSRTIFISLPIATPNNKLRLLSFILPSLPHTLNFFNFYTYAINTMIINVWKIESKDKINSLKFISSGLSALMDIRINLHLKTSFIGMETIVSLIRHRVIRKIYTVHAGNAFFVALEPLDLVWRTKHNKIYFLKFTNMTDYNFY